MTTQQETRGWVETDVEAAEKAYEEWGEGRERAIKPPAGDSQWWVCPAMPGATQGAIPFRDGIFVHFVHSPDNPDTLLAVGVCPTKTRSQPCAWCAFLSRMKRTQGLAKADLDYCDDEAAKEHIICHAIRLDGDDDDLKVEFMDVPIGCYKQLNQVLKDRKNGLDFTHPEKGCPIIFTKEGTGRNGTKYFARTANARPMPKQALALLSAREHLETVYPELNHESLAGVANVILAKLGADPIPVQWAGADRQLPAGDGK